jgi:glycosidase
MPIMQSPSYHGYDVVDYFTVDDEYGTEDDFRRLIEEAHARGIRVVVDLVINHTSSEHPWFQESQNPDSDQRDWYIWADDNPGYRGPSSQQVWHSFDDDYYYALFWDRMPDLNYDNPEVTEAIYDAAAFWLEDMGTDGFRLDAVKHLVENGPLQENTSATHDWLEDYYTFYKDVDSDAFTVGEAWTSTQQVLEYTGDEVDIAFQFELAKDILNSSEVGLGSLYVQELSPIVEKFPKNQFATFITNHDQNRVMSELEGDNQAAKVAAALLLTGPGVPFIYYGEEIGMMGTKPDEDIRRPMQWSGDADGAGFTDGQPWRDPHDDYPERNVDLQIADPDSLLNHYRTLIQLRNQSDALRVGEWTSVKTKPNKIVAFVRHTDNEKLLVIINPSGDAIDEYVLNLDSGPFESQAEAKLIFGDGLIVNPTNTDDGGFSDYRPLESLPPQSTFIIDLTP